MINLLPDKLKEDRLYGRRNRMLLTYSFLVLLIGVSSIGIMFFNLQFVNGDIDAIRTEIEDRKTIAKIYEADQEDFKAIAEDLKTIESLYEGELIFSELIPQIGALLPPGTVLNGLSLSGGKDDPINLEIDMDRQDLAAVFQQNLVSSDLFAAADVTSIISKGDDENNTPAQRIYSFGATLTALFEETKKPTTGNKVESIGEPQ